MEIPESKINKLMFRFAFVCGKSCTNCTEDQIKVCKATMHLIIHDWEEIKDEHGFDYLRGEYY